MSKGHVKLHRSINNWEHRDNPYAFSIFIYLVTNAAYKKTKYFGHEIRRGQWCGSAREISEHTGINRKTVKKWLETLKDTGEITWIILEGGYRIFTMLKYHKYQATPSKRGGVNDDTPLYGDNLPHLLYGDNLPHRKEVSRKKKKSIPLDGGLDSGEELIDDSDYIEQNKKKDA